MFFTPAPGFAYSLAFSFLLFLCAAFAQGQVLDRSGEDSTIFISHTVFLPKESMSAGQQNWCISKADLNGDGREDLLVGSKLDGKVHIYLSEGQGRFREGGSVLTRPHNRAMTMFHGDADGLPDLATVTMKGELCIAKNLGAGRFGGLQVHQVGGLLQDVVATDVDGDGYEDLLVAATTIGQVVWFRNEGNFQFHRAASWKVGTDPRSLAVGDLNADGYPDLVVGCDDGHIYLYAGGPEGFSRWAKYGSGRATWSLVIADLNDDGLPDIAGASYVDKWLSIHLQRPEGGFRLAQQVLSGDHNFDLVVADFDLDGDLDLATCSTLDNAIGFHLNDGSGHFTKRHSLNSGDWNAAMVVTDVDQDGDDDLVVASINDHQIHIHRNISIHPDKVEKPAEVICLSGFVIDELKNTKISGAPVSLRRETDQRILATSVTDAEGFFEFCDVAPGAYLLIGRAPTFPVTERSFVMPETHFHQDLLLKKEINTFLYGLITHAVSRVRLPGATVQILDSSGQVIFTTLTDEKGRYQTAIEPGPYEVRASMEGFASDSAKVEVTKEDTYPGKRQDLALTPTSTDACLSGVVYDTETGKRISQAVIAIRDQEGKPIRKIRSAADGAYRVCLPYGIYQFSTTAKGYFFQVDDLEVKEPEPENELVHDIYLKPLKENAHIVLEHIYFDVDQSTLRPESIEELERVKAILSENPSLVVSIEGHTDSDASDEYNLDLSDRRAGAVVNYLIEGGIRPARLLYEGFGEGSPIAPNDSPANKQLNRRTEFRVVSF